MKFLYAIGLTPENLLINFGADLLMSIANRETVERSLAKYNSINSCDLFLTGTSAFADIVRPDCSKREQQNA